MTVSFDKKLAELDAYLQMLIEQSEKLDNKLELASSESEKDGLQLIKSNLESLLGSIKHAIVLLQIAKVSIKTSSPTPQPTLSPTPQPTLSQSKSSTANHNFNSLSNSTSSSIASDNKSAAATAVDPTSTTPNNSPKPPARAFRRHSQQQQQQSHLASTNSSLASQKASSPGSQQSRGSCSAKAQPDERQLDSKTGPQATSLDAQSPSSSLAHTNSQHHQTFCSTEAPTKSSGEDPLVRDGASVGGDLVDDDDDDAFYDAADEQHLHQSAGKVSPLLRSLEINDNKQSKRFGSITSNSDPTAQQGAITIATMSKKNMVEDGSIDWDALYDEEEEDLGSLESEGSVIKHLMSQIRIGMDLTKVVLPTFILERRSLLEMYADFFAHPDLFSSIPDYETPEERMVQIVRWYLSAFHAGRKSSVAKKPYNPILGEIFLCHWNLNSISNNNAKPHAGEFDNKSNKQDEQQFERTNSSESTFSVGDIENFSRKLPKNSLLFVAEQVSHHPPVSAFYAENLEKAISCCAHIYTKSKYLGLSVGVQNIGHGVIKLLKHNETYVCTFPSAYGRSILTVPWVELGGSVNITCEQTNYSANIEFVTKPFYGGKKHRVVAEILRPNKEPFMTIDGEWNGCMYSKSPPNSGEKQVFVDTTCLPVIKKQVRSISSQESFESRNVWKEVTRALKLHDVSSATAAKTFIEQKQRDLLKDRNDKGIKWRTRYFENMDDGWTYAKPLEDRLRSN